MCERQASVMARKPVARVSATLRCDGRLLSYSLLDREKPLLHLLGRLTKQRYALRSSLLRWLFRMVILGKGEVRGTTDALGSLEALAYDSMRANSKSAASPMAGAASTYIYSDAGAR